MRRLLLVAAMFGAVQGAQAADLPDLPILRGALQDGLSSAKVNWQGFYIGGQGGYGSANMNFAGADNGVMYGIQPRTGLTPDQYPTLGKTNPTGAAYGGFAGYNWQFEDIVVGIDASYLHGNFNGSSTGQDMVAGPFYRYRSTATASANVHDFGSLRARAGYMVGNFLPYVTGGIGLGSADIVRTAGVYDLASPIVTSQTSRLGDHFVYGYSAGLGIDVMLVGGLFFRAEYEYQRITSPVDIGMNTVRGGLGYKF